MGLREIGEMERQLNKAGVWYPKRSVPLTTYRGVSDRQRVLENIFRDAEVRPHHGPPIRTYGARADRDRYVQGKLVNYREKQRQEREEKDE